MPDQFEVLRTPVEAVYPDPEFASHLRARIERALTLPKGVTVSDLDIDLEPVLDPAFESTTALRLQAALGRAAITPYIAVAGAAEAIRWYGVAFGARSRMDPIIMPDGRIGHAEIEIGGALIMLADEFPEIGFFAPSATRPSTITLHLNVENVDVVVENAIAEGAESEGPVSDFEYGRQGSLRDPFGHRWIIGSDPSPRSDDDQSTSSGEPVVSFREGDIGYMSLWVHDTPKAATFFSSVLGWEYAPASGPQGRRVIGQSLHHGMWESEEGNNLFCCYAVGDLSDAVQRVRSAGGTASDSHQEPYGLIADCVDDQGVQFALFEPPEGMSSVDRSGDSDEAEAKVAPRQGDVAYVTMEVVESEKARAFYGAVLGWEFDAGRVADGWQVRDVSPMVGLSGGHRIATTIPMYRVDDIDEAVGAVLSAGGTATSPETNPYGITSDCTDDQGTRFYLGQLS
ncbi:MAG: VOC family protein [Acidimicrobiales bacterium]